MWVDATEDYHRKEGGERHVRRLSDGCWISVLHRLTGFGHMEWETAICFCDTETGKQIKGSPFIVRGDWREELSDKTEGELLYWYKQKLPDNRTAFDALMCSLSGETTKRSHG